MTREKMKSQFNKILIVTFVILFFTLSKSYSIEDVSEFTDAINEAREELNNVPEASTEQSKIIDEALKEIDKATEFAQEAINSNNAEDAIKTLEFIEKSLSDVQNIIPKEFGSDMSKIDTAAMPKEDMAVITELTAQMKTSKEKKENDFMSDLVDLNMRGIDTISISENLNGLGIDTIKVVLDVDNTDKLEKWTKEQWAASYKGSILTTAGTETITDKEISSKVLELEDKFKENTLKIDSKRKELSLLNSQLNPVSAELESLNEKKSLLTAQYNLEIEKIGTVDLTNLETQKSIEISDKLKVELNDITNEISEVEKQSVSLKENISKLNLEINNDKIILNKISVDLLNSERELNNTIASVNSKQSQLESLLNNDISKTNQDLTKQLNEISRERDFIESKFDKSINKEVAAFETYFTALGNVDSKYFAEEVEFSIREVGVILDADPRKARAFDIEKYATFAGLSKDFIQKGIEAVNKDDWETQKNVYLARDLLLDKGSTITQGAYY